MLAEQATFGARKALAANRTFRRQRQHLSSRVNAQVESYATSELHEAWDPRSR